MSYARTLPRDLFNEAGLLKAIGQLILKLEEIEKHNADLTDFLDEPFRITQDPASGNIYVANLPLSVGGRAYRMERHLNSRSSYCLWIEEDPENPDFEPVEVLDDQGNITDEMMTFIGAS